MAKSSGGGGFPPPEKLSPRNVPLPPPHQFYAYGCYSYYNNAGKEETKNVMKKGNEYKDIKLGRKGKRSIIELLVPLYWLLV